MLRYVAGPLQQMTDGRLDASILRQLLIALAMIGIMLSRPRGLWPSPEHGRVRAGADTPPAATPGPGGELPVRLPHELAAGDADPADHRPHRADRPMSDPTAS